MRPRLIVPLLALLLLAVGAGPAIAAVDPVTTIDFDALANDADITTQYTGLGVTFTANGATGTPHANVVPAGQASSGSVVAMSQCFACEFVHDSIKGVFGTSTSSVTLRTGVPGNTCAAGEYAAATVTLSAYRADNALVSADSQNVPSCVYHTQLHVTSGADDIAYFTVVASNDAFQFAIDDLAFPVPTVPGAPDVNLESSGTASVRQGASVDVPITINRVNGSNGNLAMGVSGLPSGVSGTFSPTVVTGSSATTTLTLAATAGAPPVEAPVTATVTATPAGPAVAPTARTLSIGVQVRSNFTLLNTPGHLVEVPSCGTGTANFLVARQFGFAGTVDLATSGVPSPLSAAISPASSTLPPNGALAMTHQLQVSMPGTGGPFAPGALTITATSPGLSPQSETVDIHHVDGFITSFEPSVAATPHDLLPGTTVVVHGGGFCSGSTLSFGSQQASVTLTPAMISPDRSTATVTLPRLATTGRVIGINPDGAFSSSAAIAVTSPRSRDGFAFENYDHPGVSFDDLKTTFGAADTNISINPCWPFYGCDIVTPIPNPLTYVFKGVANQLLAGNGSCYGMMVTGRQLATGRIHFSDFTPAGATTVSQLGDASGPAPALRTHIRQWHVVQFSSEGIQSWVTGAAAAIATSGSSYVHSVVHDELAAGRRPLVMIRDDGGHVLTATNLRETGGGNFEIDVYDPNLPFVATELTDGGSHAARESNGTIVVSAAGNWTYQGAFAPRWSGGSGSLVPVRFSSVPTDPTLPTSVSGLLSLLIPFAAGSNPATQVTDGRGHTLLNADGTPNTDPATSIPGGSVFRPLTGGASHPVYAVPAAATAHQSISVAPGTTYGEAALAPGFAAQASGLEGSGTADALTLSGTRGELTLDPAKAPGAMDLVLGRTDAGGGVRGATLHLTGVDAAPLQVTLARGRGGLDLHSGGTTTVTGAISWSGADGVAGSATLPASHLGAGERLLVQPASWNRMGAGSTVRVTIRDRHGKVRAVTVVTTDSTRNRWVKSVRLTATSTGRARQRVRFTSTLRGVPRSAQVQQLVQVLRGRTVVATYTRVVPARRAHGAVAWSLDLRLPKGSYSVRAGAAVVVSSPRLQVSNAGARTALHAH